MRVTDSSIYASIRKQVMRGQARLTEAQERATSGLRVAKPSDDPIAAAAARRDHARQALAEAGMKTADVANSQLLGADSATGDAYETMVRAREIAMQAASSTMDGEARANMAIQVRQLKEQMVTIANTNVLGRYVFAGENDDKTPYSADGTSYTGGNTPKDVQVMPGTRFQAGITGRDVFGDETTPNNVFTTLENLAAALEANDQGGAHTALTAIDADQFRLSKARTKVGTMMNGLTTAQAVADRHAFQSKQEISRLTEADSVGTLTDLVQAKGALEAALAIANQIPVGTLAGGK